MVHLVVPRQIGDGSSNSSFIVNIVGFSRRRTGDAIVHGDLVRPIKNGWRPGIKGGCRKRMMSRYRSSGWRALTKIIFVRLLDYAPCIVGVGEQRALAIFRYGLLTGQEEQVEPSLIHRAQRIAVSVLIRNRLFLGCGPRGDKRIYTTCSPVIIITRRTILVNCLGRISNH